MSSLTLFTRPLTVHERHSGIALLASALLSLTACGGASSDAQTAADPKADEASEAEITQEEAALLEQIEAGAAETDATAGVPGEDAKPSEDGPEERETVYRVSQDGMKVTIGGAEFIPKAEAVRVGSGWGVKVTVSATSTEEMLLYSAASGPLAFGGTVTRDSVAKFGDKREGGSEQKLSPGAPLTFERTWPAAGEKGLAKGEEVLLMVGLWGLGTTTENRRPVTKFVVVKMVSDGKGKRPTIQPPSH